MTDNDRPKSWVFDQALLQDFVQGKLSPAIEEMVVGHLEARPQLLEKISSKAGSGFRKKFEAVKSRSASGLSQGDRGRIVWILV